MIFPLAVLTALYFFDEFDTAAFATLAPDIKRSFDLTDEKFIGLVIVNVAFVVLLAVPVGYLADRVSRVRLVVLSGILAGTFSLTTGLAVSIGFLIVSRFGNGVGLLANSPIHNSLLSDYYTPNTRPSVFANVLRALHTDRDHHVCRDAAGRAGPRRHRQTRESVTRERPTPQVLRGVPHAVARAHPAPHTHCIAVPRGRDHPARRLLAPVLRAGVRNRTTGPGCDRCGQRGVHVHRRTAGRKAHAAMVRQRHARTAASPWLATTIAIGLTTNYLLGYFFAPLAATQALVSPARERSLSFSLGAIFLVMGLILFFVFGLGSISDNYGIRWAFVALAPFWIVGGAVAASAGKFVEADVAAVFA